MITFSSATSKVAVAALVFAVVLRRQVLAAGEGTAKMQEIATAVQEDADAIGLSILSGAHMTLFARVIELLRERDAGDILVFGGGIIPDADVPELKSLGVAEIFTPGASTQAIVDWVRANVGVKPAAT